MTRRRVYLVRHAHVVYFGHDGRPLDPRGVSLSTEGRAQADALARALAGIPFDRAICSPYPRTAQTAQRVLGARRLPLETIDGLREIRAGRLREIDAGALRARLAYAYDDAHDDEAAFVGGETFGAFSLRVSDAFDAVLRAPGWSTLLAVLHDGVNRFILADALGATRTAIPALEQDLGCFNIIDVDLDDDGGVVRRLVRAVNVTPYDPAKTQISRTSMEAVYEAYVTGIAR